MPTIYERSLYSGGHSPPYKAYVRVLEPASKNGIETDKIENANEQDENKDIIKKNILLPFEL